MSLGLGKIIPKDTAPTQALLDKTKVSLFYIPVQTKTG